MSDSRKKGLRALEMLERWILVIFGIAATIVMFANAASRYIFKTTFVWAEEVIRILFVWSMFLAVTTSFLRNDHIGFDGLSKKKGFPNLVYRIVYALSLTVVGAILCIYGYKYNVFVGSVPLAGTSLPTAILMWPGILAGASWAALGVFRLVKIFVRPEGGNAK